MSRLFFAYPTRPSRRLLLAGAMCFVLVLLPTAGNVRATSTAQTAPTATPTVNPTTGKPILLTDPVPDPQQPGVQFFSPTGHTLRGSFLSYWQQNGGLAQFGYPLTEEFTEPIGPNNSPIMVQYFERNRFEHHPENGAVGAPNEVLLGTLGRAFHSQDAPSTQLPAPADYFPQTGHNLSGTFQAYWHSHGGLAIYGYPITEQFQEQSPTDHKTYTVQYFERARMELHPENAGTPYEVLLGQLGRQLSEKEGYPYGWYPAFGYAGDYSWFAGFYKQDPRKLYGCRTVMFVSPGDATYSDVEEVLPYGEEWTSLLNKYRLEATFEPQTLIVVFGQLDDTNSIAKGKEIASCSSPKFKVTGLQFSKAR